MRKPFIITYMEIWENQSKRQRKEIWKHSHEVLQTNVKANMDGKLRIKYFSEYMRKNFLEDDKKRRYANFTYIEA